MPDMSASKIESQYMMFTGTPGTRKSTQALTWPKPLFFFSWDQKMESMKLPIKKFGYDSKQIMFEDYSDWTAARGQLEKFQVEPKYNGQQIKTIVIDSVTSAADCALRQTLKLKMGLTRQSGATAGKVIAGIPVNEIEDYNAEASALMELVALTKDIHKFHKVNIILIAHLIQAEYKSNPAAQGNIVRTIVTAGKRVAPKFPAYSEEVYHFFIKRGFDADSGGKYAILTESTSEDFARTGLELGREIVFEDKPLYENWIKPAIDKLNITL